MRTELDYLPADIQRELEQVVQTIFEEFENEHKLALGSRKIGRILKILLYGSFARGTWVYEPTTEKAYTSDYDILIIVNQDDLVDGIHWLNLEDRLTRDFAVSHRLRRPVSIIVHTLQEVNNNLSEGRFFFTDMAKDAVALYQLDDSELAVPRPKTADEALALAQEYFAEWFPSAGQFFRQAQYAMADNAPKIAAFLYHQATERLYHTVLLTCTLYTPHSHNIAHLRSISNRIDRRLLHVWTEDSKVDKRRFRSLKDAYVKARYSKHYRIGADDLAWLGIQVQELSRVVEAVCRERIEDLERKATQLADSPTVRLPG